MLSMGEKKRAQRKDKEIKEEIRQQQLKSELADLTKEMEGE